MKNARDQELTELANELPTVKEARAAETAAVYNALVAKEKARTDAFLASIHRPVIDNSAIFSQRNRLENALEEAFETFFDEDNVNKDGTRKSIHLDEWNGLLCESTKTFDDYLYIGSQKYQVTKDTSISKLVKEILPAQR